MFQKRKRANKKPLVKMSGCTERKLTYQAHDEWGSPESEYKFEYKFEYISYVGGHHGSWSWKIYIISKPEYFIINNYNNVRGHWISDKEEGKKYVCWDGNIANLEDAILISKMWADMHQRYVATGNFEA